MRTSVISINIGLSSYTSQLRCVSKILNRSEVASTIARVGYRNPQPMRASPNPIPGSPQQHKHKKINTILSNPKNDSTEPMHLHPNIPLLTFPSRPSEYLFNERSWIRWTKGVIGPDSFLAIPLILQYCRQDLLRVMMLTHISKTGRC